MKRFFVVIGILSLLFGFCVKFGTKNFPMNGETAALISSGVVVSTNPYELLKTGKYLAVENEVDYRIVEVVSQKDFGYVNRKIADNDQALLYQWKDNIYPSTLPVDWIQYGKKVQKQADSVFWFCIFLALLALCCYRTKVKLEMIKRA